MATLKGAKADVHFLGELFLCFGFSGDVIGFVIHNDAGVVLGVDR